MDLPSGSPSQIECYKVARNAQTALTDARGLVEGLRAPAVDHRGLLPTLQQHAT
jgi:hypothetical protein